MCASGHRKENWAEEAKQEGAEMAATEVLTNGQRQEERVHTRGLLGSGAWIGARGHLLGFGGIWWGREDVGLSLSAKRLKC